MAIYISLEEMQKQVKGCEEILWTLRRNLSTFVRRRNALEAEGQSGSTVNTSINNLLTDWDALRDEVVTVLGAIPNTYKIRVKVGMPSQYMSAIISPVDPVNAGRGTIRVGNGPDGNSLEPYVNPFGGLFLDNDKIIISQAEDSANNGTHRLWFDAMEWYSSTPLYNHITGSTADADFSSTWTGSGSGHWTLTSTTATHNTGNTTALEFPGISLTAATDNKPHILKFTVSSMTAGSVTAAWLAGIHSRTVTANGTYECIVTGQSGDSVKFTPTSAFDGVISAVSMRRWTGLAFDSALGAANTADTSIVVSLEER